MSRDSQGLYTLPAGNPVVPGTLIESTWANGTMNDIAQALTDSLPRNGSAPMTGPLTLAATAPTLPRHATSKSYVDQFIAYATGMPLGGILAMAAGTAPPGFLLCDGSAVSRTTYAALFASIGTIYGAGDGATTFNLPNLQGQFIRGRDASRTVGSTQAGSIQSHNHPVSDPTHWHPTVQDAHSHFIATDPHGHPVSDPGHAHVYLGQMEAVSDGNDRTVLRNSGNSVTNGALTGISVISAPALGGTADARQPVITNTPAATGVSVAAAGESETVPQNIALDYYIKAVEDSTSSPGVVETVTSSDVNMIVVDNTDPLNLVLDIQSNLALGIPKLDSSGLIQVSQIPPLPQYVASTGGDMTGNLNFTSLSAKIKGIFSGTPLANRTFLQTNVPNGSTNVGLIPDGTGVSSSVVCYDRIDHVNNSSFAFRVNSTPGISACQIISSAIGTASFLPITFNVNNSTRLTITDVGQIIPAVSEYADDVAAAAAGIVLGAMYRTGNVLKVRIA